MDVPVNCENTGNALLELVHDLCMQAKMGKQLTAATMAGAKDAIMSILGEFDDVRPYKPSERK